MKIKSIVAYEIWTIREDLDIPGDNEHDWWLAEQFLQEKEDQFDEEDIYEWFIQLDESMYPGEKTLDRLSG